MKPAPTKDSVINKPVLMIGMPRSGTTVLSEAVSLHEELGWFSNYLSYFPFLPWVSLLDRISNLSVAGWRLRGKRKQEDGLGSSVRRFLPHCSEAFSVWRRCCGQKFLWEYLSGQTASEEEKRRITKCIDKVLTLQSKSRFFTKLTGPPRIFYLNSLFEGAFYVHVVRDPRAVVSSLIEAPFWKTRGGLVRPWWLKGLTKKDVDEWNRTGGSAVALNAIQWRRVVESTWEEKDLIPPERYLELRYEDFVEKPHRILRLIFERLQLKDSTEAHRYISTIGRIRNMNYKYKRHLTQNDISLVCEITSKTAEQAGYHL
jgi:hypothetical protein